MRRGRCLFLGLASLLAACGNSSSRQPEGGTYRLSEARLWVGERPSAILCEGNFVLEAQTSSEHISLTPKGSGSCEARGAPSFSLSWGGDCTLGPVTFFARSGRSYKASAPKLSCSGDPTGSNLSLENHRQGFSLVARGDRGLTAEYFFERVP